MDKARIEKAARGLQLEIYNNAGIIFATVPPLTRLFEPDVAARVCGFEYELRPSLGTTGSGNERFETAGMIYNDADRSTVVISTRFPYEVQRFTGAHEIGHMVLHSHLTLHRDRPLSGESKGFRSLMEQEADYFAACFLAPPKLVRLEFEARFGPSPLALTHDTAFHLKGAAAMHELLNARTGSLDFAGALASATHFAGHHFKSMAEAFGMSTKAMAIRLEELRLAIY